MISYRSIVKRAVGVLVVVMGVLAGTSVVASPSASAAGCVLGPGLGSAALRAGVSCPTGDGDGAVTGEGSVWGKSFSSCTFPWPTGGAFSEVTDFLDGKLYISKSFSVSGDVKLVDSVYHDGGEVIGRILIRKRPDKTFSISVTVYGRPGGPTQESIFFDCAKSSTGPNYNSSLPEESTPPPPSAPMPMPEPEPIAPPTPTPTRAGVKGAIATYGSMSTVSGNQYLLRFDVTNTGTSSNFAEIALGLDGYDVVGFPTLATGMSCTPLNGLICSYDGLAAGQTVTTVLLVTASGDAAETESVDVAVLNDGFRRFAVRDGGPIVSHADGVANFYRIAKP